MERKLNLNTTQVERSMLYIINVFFNFYFVGYTFIDIQFDKNKTLKNHWLERRDIKGYLINKITDCVNKTLPSFQLL